MAFTYEQAPGIRNLYLDGSIIGSTNATPNQALYWGANPGTSKPELQVGVAMDGYNFSKTATDNGFIDEIRISNRALSADELLLVPEPSTYGAIFGFGVLVYRIFTRRRCRD